MQQYNRNIGNQIIKSLLLIMSLAACEEETSHGRCVGIDHDSRDPKLQYEVSVQNLILGAIFSETIVVPAVVVFSDLYCPVGEK